ncbi:MAG: CRP-like cAMP-binding protein/post-segregation antitoxin (ccd killing protein) [Verrucomicrobiales bacterium]
MEIITTIDEQLLNRAKAASGHLEVAKLLESALEALIEREGGKAESETNLEARDLSPMDTDGLARIVANQDFFEELSREEIEGLLTASTQRAYSPGQTLIERGDQGTSMFIVRKGYVEVWVGSEKSDEEVAVAKLQPGEFFGEMSLLTGAARTATIRALTTTVTEEISKESFRALLHKRPELLGIMSRIIAERRLRLKLAQEDQAARLPDSRSLAGQLLDRMKAFFGS